MKTLKQNMKGQDIKLRQCYVYEIQIDGVVRYIGKGRNGRIYSYRRKRPQQVRRQDSQSISAFSENASAVRRGLNI